MKESYQNGDIKYPFVNYVDRKNRFIFDEAKDYDEQLNKLKKLISTNNQTNKKTRLH